MVPTLCCALGWLIFGLLVILCVELGQMPEMSKGIPQTFGSQVCTRACLKHELKCLPKTVTGANFISSVHP